VDVGAEVNPYLVIAEIADRASTARGPALLFRRPAGSELPVLVDQFGSERRLELAFGSRLEVAASRIAELGDLGAGTSAERGQQDFVGLSAFAHPHRVGRLRHGSWTVLTSACSLCSRRGPATARLASRCRSYSPSLGKAAATRVSTGCRGQFGTRAPREARRRARSRCVSQLVEKVFEAVTTGMHWRLDHDGAANYRDSEGRLQISVAIGTDLEITHAVSVPLPPRVDEFTFAGYERGAPVEPARCETVDLEVPAEAPPRSLGVCSPS
jgi:4-hydroxy-3-polyprenylbenzoate decarboxylase